jgi:D-sedoheptulose 7-phosphate isomerase
MALHPLRDFVQLQIREALDILQRVADAPQLQEILIAAAEATAESLLRSGKLLAAGNGGSAADAQHLVAEFVVRLTADRPPLRAVALTTDSSIITAASNDYGYERVFARQVEALGMPGDIFLGISTSGKSRNILLALQRAKAMEMKTIGLCGSYTAAMEPYCDFLRSVPSIVTQHVQECHFVLEHTFCALVERCCFGCDPAAAAIDSQTANT